MSIFTPFTRARARRALAHCYTPHPNGECVKCYLFGVRFRSIAPFRSYAEMREYEERMEDSWR